jgi:hypothetical protein
MAGMAELPRSAGKKGWNVRSHSITKERTKKANWEDLLARPEVSLCVSKDMSAILLDLTALV